MTARHHQHADHERGFRLHVHDGLGRHLHHRGPDYVMYPVAGDWSRSYSFTGTPDEVLADAHEGAS